MAELDNPQHERFCREYLIDLNQTQAAIRAGYGKGGARTQGSVLCANPDIQKRIAELKAERSELTKIDAAYVLQRAHMIHEACWSDGDSKNSIAALKLLGDHVNVQAFRQHTQLHGEVTVNQRTLDDFYAKDEDE